MNPTSVEAEPFLNRENDSIEADHPHEHEAAVGNPIGWTRWRLLGAEVTIWTVQHITASNVLLIFVPLGLGAGILKADTVTVSMFNFFAIIPLSALVSDHSDKLSYTWGPLIGGLMNATFGNAVELTVGILAILRDEMRIAQSAMLGSILSDILLVLGGCLVAAAYGRGILKFNGAVVDTLSSLMVVTTMALILPTVLYSTFTKKGVEINDKIRSFSHTTTVVLIIIYAFYLNFQLRTHKEIFLDEDDDVDAASGSGDSREGNGGGEQDPEQQDGPERSTQTPYADAAVLIGSGAAIMICTKFFLDSLDATSKFTHLSKTFIATILIPVASNAPECMAVILASRKERINFAIGVIVGSILQIALFVLPILVIIGWGLDKPMTLYFSGAQTSILFLAVLMVNHLLQEGSYTYLHGIMLLSLYAVVGVAIFLQPVD